MLGVSISFVRAISRGASIRPASPDAETIANSDSNGAGEDIRSMLGREDGDGRAFDIVGRVAGSGRARTAHIRDRRKELMVLESTE